MIVKETKCAGLFLIELEPKGDERGFFLEVYRKDIFSAFNIPTEFVQENHTKSKKGALRGLHFQYDPLLGKLIRIVRGKAFAVAVDIRVDSSTLGEWVGGEFSLENNMQMYAPPGFATGFCVTGDTAEVEYHYTSLYNPKGESNIIWNDNKIGINWPISGPLLSERDQKAQTMDEWLLRPEAQLFKTFSGLMEL